MGALILFAMMIEAEIKGALGRLMEAIKQADGPVMAQEMARLDDIVQRQRAGLHPQLVHFLERRSYPKAMMWLEGDANIPAGICGGGRRGGA